METLLIEKLLAFAMVLTRISAFFLFSPVFGWETIPMTIKVAATVLLSVFFSLTNPPAVAIEQASAVQAMLLLVCEAEGKRAFTIGPARQPGKHQRSRPKHH